MVVADRAAGETVLRSTASSRRMTLERGVLGKGNGIQGQPAALMQEHL
jgi:hypothetical protein